MKRNSDGNLVIETTMVIIRLFSGWQDDLDMPDDTTVIVCEDGSVSCAETGDRICESGFGGSQEAEREWNEYWGFQDSDELNGRR